MTSPPRRVPSPHSERVPIPVIVASKSEDDDDIDDDDDDAERDRQDDDEDENEDDGMIQLQQQQRLNGEDDCDTTPMMMPMPTTARKKRRRLPQHLYILPVLLMEFLAISLTRAVLPSLILQTFEENVYLFMGCAECIRGLLAFVACPLFGKVSDVTGRRPCLFVTVLGTCAPVCSLALMTYDYDTDFLVGPIPSKQRIWIFVYLLAFSGLFSSTFTLVFAYISDVVPKQKDRVTAYGLALATFGLSFTVGPMAGGYLARVDVYDDGDGFAMGGGAGAGQASGGEEEEAAIISATTLDGEVYNNGEFAEGHPASGVPSVPAADDAAAYHHAVNEDHIASSSNPMYPAVDPLGQQRVFTCALILTVLDLLYIYFILPESVPTNVSRRRRSWNNASREGKGAAPEEAEYNGTRSAIAAAVDDEEDGSVGGGSSIFSATRSLQERVEAWRQDVLPQSWTPLDALRVFSGDPFLAEVGRIAFLYYTGLWAVISTLVIYAAKRFHYGPERLGELMSAFGLCTMLAEAVLLRLVVPTLGEKRTMRLGLAAFALQCLVLGLAYRGWHLFICVALSMVSNLVYPSLTSLVSQAVPPHAVGEALGAVNGVKALTEGIGPLLFGGLMTVSEGSRYPGWPYFIAGVFAVAAYRRTKFLPSGGHDDDDGEEEGDWYISEKYAGAKSQARREGRVHSLMRFLGGGGGASSRTNSRSGDRSRGGGHTSKNSPGVQAILNQCRSGMDDGDGEEELRGLLSDVDDLDCDSNEGRGSNEETYREDSRTKARRHQSTSGGNQVWTEHSDTLRGTPLRQPPTQRGDESDPPPVAGTVGSISSPAGMNRNRQKMQEMSFFSASL